jgi:hypothetical protein
MQGPLLTERLVKRQHKEPLGIAVSTMCDYNTVGSTVVSSTVVSNTRLYILSTLYTPPISPYPQIPTRVYNL